MQHDQPRYISLLEQIERTKKQDFFDTELKTTLADKGTLYAGMLELCEHAFPETAVQPQLTDEAAAGGKDPAQIDAGTTERKSEAKKPEEKPKPRTLTDILLGFYDTDQLDRLVASISKSIKEGTEKRIDSGESKNMQIGYVYSCVDLVHRGKYAAALKLVQDLISTVVAPEALLNQDNNKADRRLAVIISATCLLTVSLALLSPNKYSTIDICEVPTFFYRVLSSDSLQSAADFSSQLAAAAPTPIPAGPDRMQEVYTAVAILLQISAHQLAVRSLFSNFSEPRNVLLGMLILYNQLNYSLSTGKDVLARDYTRTLRKVLETVVAKLPCKLAATSRLDMVGMSLLSTTIGLTGRATGFAVAWTALPNFVVHLRSLLQTSAIVPDQAVPAGGGEPVTICTFVAKLAKHFCACSTEACQRVFRLYFTDRSRASLFNYLMQETAQIVAMCIKNKLIELTGTAGWNRGELVRVGRLGTIKAAEDVRASTVKLLNLVWELVLLLSVEGYRGRVDLSALAKVKLAGYLIRYSAMGANEQQELEYIQQGLQLLRTVNYSELKLTLPAENEAIHDLGNAFEVYTDKWEGIIKNEKLAILTQIKMVSPSA